MKFLTKAKNCGSSINNSFGQAGIIIIFLIAVPLCVFLWRFFPPGSPLLVLGLAGGVVISLITLLNTDLALVILILSMLLSPEIPIAQVPQRAVVIRIDDILLLFMFFTWLAKMAVNKELGLLRKTPINKPLGVYVVIYLFSTLWGIFQGRVQPLQSFFYILKYTEYFIIFFMFTNNIHSERQVKAFTFVFFFTCILVCIFALATRDYYGRVSAPFEGMKGEPNTLAGYLLLLCSAAIGYLIYNKSKAYRLFLFCLICLIVPTFLFTLSRGGYIGFIAMYLAHIILTRKARVNLIGILMIALLLIIFIPGVIPYQVKKRIKSTFAGQEYGVLGKKLKLEPSAAQRVIVWKWILEKWQKHPVFGWGVTALGLVDNQYALILGEVGFIGMTAFLWLMFTLFRNALAVFRIIEIEELRGLASGFIAGFTGILVHSFAGNIFIIVRIMEPFWFLAALVAMLPQVSALPYAPLSAEEPA